jgi:hypothetical protein
MIRDLSTEGGGSVWADTGTGREWAGVVVAAPLPGMSGVRAGAPARDRATGTNVVRGSLSKLRASRRGSVTGHVEKAKMRKNTHVTMTLRTSATWSNAKLPRLTGRLTVASRPRTIVLTSTASRISVKNHRQTGVSGTHIHLGE